MTRVRSIRRQAHLDRLWEAQGKCCYLCGEKMYPGDRYHHRRGWTADHVRPRAIGGSRWQNLLLAHAGCNNDKGDRPPHPCELLLLNAMNTQLHEEARWRHGYADDLRGPSPLAVAFERAMAA